MLQLSYCSHISDKAVGWILRNCPNLEELYLSGCVRITDKACSMLANNGTPLQLSSFQPRQRSHRVTGIIAPPGQTRIRVLDLTSCSRITITGLAQLSTLTSLRTLFAPPCLGKWNAISDAWLWRQTFSFAQIDTLRLLGTTVRQEFITEIVPKRFPNLAVLDLSGTKFISELDQSDEDALQHTKDAWKSMMAMMPRLCDINLRACSGLPRDLLLFLQATCHQDHISC